MRLEYLAGEGRGGDDEGGDAAELEAEEGTVGSGEQMEGSVGEGAEQLVEVTDDREARRAGCEAEPAGFFVGFIAAEVEEQHQREGDE